MLVIFQSMEYPLLLNHTVKNVRRFFFTFFFPIEGHNYPIILSGTHFD